MVSRWCETPETWHLLSGEAGNWRSDLDFWCRLCPLSQGVVPDSGDSSLDLLTLSSREALRHLWLECLSSRHQAVLVMACTSSRCCSWTCLTASFMAWSCSFTRASSWTFSLLLVIIRVVWVCRAISVSVLSSTTSRQPSVLMMLLSSNSEPAGHPDVTESTEAVIVVTMMVAQSSLREYILRRVLGSQQKGMGYPPMWALCHWQCAIHSSFFMTLLWICVRFPILGWPMVRFSSHCIPLKENHRFGTSQSGGLHSFFSWWCCPSRSLLHIWQCHRHCAASCSWSCTRGLCIGVPPFPGMVSDANGKPDPGKGGKNDPTVLDMHPLLAIQVEGPQITVNEEVQSGLWLRESGHHGIANWKCVRPSNLSEIYSKDALKYRSTYLFTFHCGLCDYNLAAHKFHLSTVCVKTGWCVYLPMPCDMDSFLEMLPPWLLVREWGKTQSQALLCPWWHHQASFLIPWHHRSLFWLAGSLSVMPHSRDFLFFVPFLSAKRSQVIILSWTLRDTRCVFSSSSGHHMCQACPGHHKCQSDKISAVGSYCSQWVYPLNLLIFQLYVLIASGSELFV